MATDKPMAPEERVTVDCRHGEREPWVVLVRKGDASAIMYRHIERFPVDLAKTWLDMAFEEVRAEAYADGQRAGARAENDACEEMVRPHVDASYFANNVRRSLADAIAARREA